MLRYEVRGALRFEPNVGQADAAVRYVARGSGYSLSLSDDGLAMALGSEDVVRMTLHRAKSRPIATLEEKLPSVTNYYLGSDPSKWRTAVPNYGRVRFKEVYPGIDIVYYGKDGKLEYDFIVSPDADPDQIRLSFSGADSLRLNPAGDLVLAVNGKELIQRKPLIFQDADGHRVEIAGQYQLSKNKEVRLALAKYDHSRPLVIDPVLVFSTYLGGTGGDAAQAIAVDASGSLYIAGFTDGSFPTLNAAQPAFRGNNDAFVTKLTPAGLLSYSTYLGGPVSDGANAIAVDASGSAYIAGSTDGSFPTLNAAQPAFGGNNDAFVTKLTPAGLLSYSTYLGGPISDYANAIAVDASGSAYIAGSTLGNFPTLNAVQPVFGGYYDAFITKLTPSGLRSYSTYLGGTGRDQANSIAVDASGNTYIAGFTEGGFPTLNAAQPAYGGLLDAFVTKLAPTGLLSYSTYLGGPFDEVAEGIAVDAIGNAYISGSSSGGSFPTLNASQPTFGGDISDAFVTKLTPSGQISYSTYLGGTGSEGASGIAVDAIGNAYIVGSTTGSFPTLNASQPVFGGLNDAFVTKLTSAGGLSYSTFLGGPRADYGEGIAVDSSGNAYIAGWTTGSFPTLNASQPVFGGTRDAFIAKISPDTPSTLSTVSPNTATAGGPTFNIVLTGTGFTNASAVTWNTTPLSTTFLSATQLTATVPASLIAGSGSAAIVVTTGGVATPPLPFTIACGASSLITISASFPFTASVGTMSVTAAAGCPWSTASPVPWITFAAPVSGTGNATITFNVQANNTATARSAILTIAGQPFTVNQAAGPTLTAVSPNTAAAGGPPFTLSLTGTGFTTASSVTWNSTVLPTTFVTSTQLTATVTSSLIGSSGSAAIAVTTGGIVTLSLPFTIGSCSSSLSSNSATFPLSASVGTVSLSTAAGCAWSTSSPVPWITFAAPASGTGNASITFNVQANDTGAARSAVIAVGGQPFTVIQAGPVCQFGLTSPTTALPSADGSGTLTIGASNNRCTWSATSSASWFRLSPTTTGTGTSTLTFTIDRNGNPGGRTAVITVNGQSISFTQAGTAACAFSLAQSSQSITASAATLTVDVISPAGCNWSAVSPVPWITIQSGAAGAGNGTVSLSITENRGAALRSAILTIAGQAFVLNQASAGSAACTVNPGIPATVAAEGRTELVGDVVVDCNNLPAGLTIDFEVSFNANITNGAAAPTLSINSATPLPGRIAGYNSIRWAAVRPAAGSASFRFSNIRVDASVLAPSLVGVAIFANLRLNSFTPIPVTNPSVVVALASPGLSVQQGSATLAAANLRSLPILFREGFAGAFRTEAGVTAPTRLLLTLRNVPAGVKVFAPVFPSSGASGAQLISANPQGEGGAPIAGATLNSALYHELTPVNGTATATWQLLSSDPLLVETLTFLVLIRDASDSQFAGMLPVLSGSFAPVSDVSIALAGAPIPRFRDTFVTQRRVNIRMSASVLGGRIRLTASNDSEIPSTANEIRNSLPTGLLLLNCSISCTESGNQVVVTIPEMKPGESRTIDINTVQDPTVDPQGGSLSNLASILSNDPPADLAATSASTTILVGGVPLALVLSPVNLTVPRSAGTAQIELASAFSTLPWTANVTSGNSWLTLSNPSGNGSGVLRLSFPENPSTASRQATIRVGNATVTITQSGAPPSVAATGPVAGVGATQTFTFRFTHPEGFQSLGVVNVLINRALDGGRACYIAYSQPAGVLFLVNDNGPAEGISAPLVLGSSANVSNSQCQINGTGSSAVGSGNVLTLTLNIAFRPAFAGNQVVYLAARDQGTGNSGWSTMGFHQVPGAPVTYPNAISMTPSAGTAAASTVSFTYEDQTSSNNIQTAWALMNTALDGRSGCYVAYFALGNILFLFPDDGRAEGLTNMVLAGNSIIENSQCRINSQGSTVVRSGARLTVNLNMTFKPGFAGPKAVWMALQTVTAVTAPWKVSGAWQVP